jgi:hypothetical protein
MTFGGKSKVAAVRHSAFGILVASFAKSDV